MAATQKTIDPINALLSEFGTRLNELEEKQKLLKGRTLLIGKNLISTKEEYEEIITDLKSQISRLNQDIKDIKQLNKRIINELSNFARKSELEILERQSKMFQPLELAKIEDVKMLIEQALKNKTNKIKKK